MATIAYALIGVGDAVMALAFLGNAMACLAILFVTLVKRRAPRRRLGLGGASRRRHVVGAEVAGFRPRAAGIGVVAAGQPAPPKPAGSVLTAGVSSKRALGTLGAAGVLALAWLSRTAIDTAQAAIVMTDQGHRIAPAGG